MYKPRIDKLDLVASKNGKGKKSPLCLVFTTTKICFLDHSCSVCHPAMISSKRLHIFFPPLPHLCCIIFSLSFTPADSAHICSAFSVLTGNFLKIVFWGVFFAYPLFFFSSFFYRKERKRERKNLGFP